LSVWGPAFAEDFWIHLSGGVASVCLFCLFQKSLILRHLAGSKQACAARLLAQMVALAAIGSVAGYWLPSGQLLARVRD
jgi:hypothetical protein